MKKVIALLIILSFVLSNAQAQCLNDNYAGVGVIEQKNTCLEGSIVIGVFEGHIGETHRGDLTISHRNDETYVEVCYYRDSKSHSAMPAIFNDTIPIMFSESGEKKVFLSVKVAQERDEENCNSCQEVVRDTLSLSVTTSERLLLRPNPAVSYIELWSANNESVGNRQFYLFSAGGKRVATYSYDIIASFVEIDVQSLAAGVYFLWERVEGEGCDDRVYRFLKVGG